MSNIICHLKRPVTFTDTYVEYDNIVIKYADVASIQYGTGWCGIGVLPLVAASDATATIRADDGKRINLVGSNLTLLMVQWGTTKVMQKEVIPLIQARIAPVLLRKVVGKVLETTDPVTVAESQPSLSTKGLHWEKDFISWRDVVVITEDTPASAYQYAHDKQAKTYYYDRSKHPIASTTDAMQLTAKDADIRTMRPRGGYDNQPIYMHAIVALWKEFADNHAVLWVNGNMFTKE